MRKVPMFTLAARVLDAGQRFRVDEAPSRTAITVRFLADRVVQKQAQRARFAQGGRRVR